MKPMKPMKLFLACSTLLAGVLVVSLNSASAENWPAWRGPRGDGTSMEKNVPTHWGAAGNVVWKTAVPGAGHASPIVWGDRVFTVTALPDTLERVLLCFERKTGRILWQQTVLRAPLEQKNAENSYASSTPAADGEKVYVTFQDGKEMAVAAYDFFGKQLWLVRPGSFASPHGFSSSPVLFKDKVIVNGDHRGDSYIVALSRADGRTLWKTPRENHTLSYSTPLIRELAGRTQMFLAGDKCVASFDPNDGSRHWVIDGPSEEFVASSVYNQRAGLLFISSSYPERHLLAIKPDGRGNVTQTHVAWRTTQGAPYVPSPIAEGDYLLTVNNFSNVAFCYEAATGKIVWQEQLGKHHASPVSANGLVYFLDDNGVMNVVRPGPEFARVARNEIGEKTFASPAISEGQIFLRGDKHLFCIGHGDALESSQDQTGLKVKMPAEKELIYPSTSSGW
jgi:outer membrane protein assembly factor BamB